MIPASQTVELLSTAITDLADITDRLREIERRVHVDRSAQLAAEEQNAELKMQADPMHDGLPYGDTMEQDDAA